MTVLLSPSSARLVRDMLAADPAIDSLVWDLTFHDVVLDKAVRFAAIYRAPAPVSPGDFIVLGGFADADVANFALLNRPAAIR